MIWQVIVCCACAVGIVGLVNGQNLPPITVVRPENGRPFEPVSFRESVAKAIRDNVNRQQLIKPDAGSSTNQFEIPNTNAQQNFNKFRQSAPNAIQRIRVPIKKKIYRQPVPVTERQEEIPTTTTTTPAPPSTTPTTRRVAPTQQHFHQRIQTFEEDYDERPAIRQPIHTPIIPQTPQVFRKDDSKRQRTDLEEIDDEQARSAQYSFSSNIDDGINDNQMSRSEARDGLAVTGMYSYSDGFFKRTVHYIADENGYRVTKEDIQPIGDGPQYNPEGKADVSSSLAGRYTVTADDFRQPSRKDKEERRRRL